jgi:hypothetical protein
MYSKVVIHQYYSTSGKMVSRGISTGFLSSVHSPLAQCAKRAADLYSKLYHERIHAEDFLKLREGLNQSLMQRENYRSQWLMQKMENLRRKRVRQLYSGLRRVLHCVTRLSSNDLNPPFKLVVMTRSFSPDTPEQSPTFLFSLPHQRLLLAIPLLIHH